MKWVSLSDSERENVIYEFQKSLRVFNLHESDSTAGLSFQVISEAYAAGLDCFVAGWPSVMDKNKRCQDPAKHNSHYDRYIGCLDGETLCNPTLFGEQICVNYKTQADKNNAYSSCENKFKESGRSFSEVLESVHEDEFNELVSTVNARCNEKKTFLPVCQKLKGRLEAFLPNVVPSSLKALEESLKKADVNKLFEATKKSQKELEKDLNEFRKVCEDGITKTEETYCKNLSLRTKKLNEILPKAYARLETFTAEDCEEGTGPAVLTSDKNNLIHSVQCLAHKEDKKCEDAIKCSIASSAFTLFSAVSEGILKNKPSKCINSQNSCAANIVSSLIKSVYSLVTGVWHLLGMAADWTGKKASEFWKDVTEVENKTSDAQNLINRMTDKDLAEVKSSPVDWVTKLATNIWQGTEIWLKEDIFCQQWEGVPRASKCLKATEGWGCLSCQDKWNGGCSAAGVVVAEVVPAFLSGGAVNLVAKTGTGAKTFAQVIKNSQKYKSVVSQVDKLADIKAMQKGMEVIKAPVKVASLIVRPVSKATLEGIDRLSRGYKVMTASKSFKVTSKAMDKASKYTGLKLINSINTRAFEGGYRFVDKALGKKLASAPSLTTQTIAKMEGSNHEVRARGIRDKLIDKIDYQFDLGETKAEELWKLKNELTFLKTKTNLSPEEAQKIRDINVDLVKKRTELNKINNDFALRLYEAYRAEGIPAKLTFVGKERSHVIQLDFSGPPTKNRAFELFRKIHKKFGVENVSVNIGESLELGALGLFDPGGKRINMGPNQAIALIDNEFNSISKHESRHAMFFSRRNAGKDSIYHVEYKASPDGQLLNEFGSYSNYMNAEEIYTFSTDLQFYGQMLKGNLLNDKLKVESVLRQTWNRADALKRVSITQENVGTEMLNSLNDLMKTEKKIQGLKLKADGDNWSVIINDKYGREAEFTFVGKEEKRLIEQLKVKQEKFSAFMNEDVQARLKASGVNLDEFAARMQSGKLTADDQRMMQKVQVEAMTSPEAVKLQKDFDNGVIPIINNAKENLEKLTNLATIQKAEAELLQSSIRNHLHEPQSVSLEEIKTQLFKTSKNAKEDYKGFALKNQ